MTVQNVTFRVNVPDDVDLDHASIVSVWTIGRPVDALAGGLDYDRRMDDQNYVQTSSGPCQ